MTVWTSGPCFYEGVEWLRARGPRPYEEVGWLWVRGLCPYEDVGLVVGAGLRAFDLDCRVVRFFIFDGTL